MQLNLCKNLEVIKKPLDQPNIKPSPKPRKTDSLSEVLIPNPSKLVSRIFFMFTALITPKKVVVNAKFRMYLLCS